MEYQFPSDEEFLEKEQEQFSGLFSDANSKRIYFSVKYAEQAHSQLQINEMRKYAIASGLIFDETNNQLVVEIGSAWVIRYAEKFEKFWQRTHRKILQMQNNEL